MAAASRIRWDRLGRWALLGMFALVLYLYIGPAVSWVSAYRQAGEKRAELAVLQARHHALLARKRELKDPKALELEARRLGMVKAGEKGFVVTLPPR